MKWRVSGLSLVLMVGFLTCFALANYFMSNEEKVAFVLAGLLETILFVSSILGFVNSFITGRGRSSLVELQVYWHTGQETILRGHLCAHPLFPLLRQFGSGFLFPVDDYPCRG